MTPREWKAFYARERDALDLDGIVARAPIAGLPAIFPHTKLAATGVLVAAVARAVVESGADRVLAIGVLHGVTGPRRIHRGDAAIAADEFSLDGFRALVEVAARRAGRRAPELVERYPLLDGSAPDHLPGLDELPRDVPVVATADPIHYGPGYGDPDAPPLDADHARRAIDATLAMLSDGRWAAFQAAALAMRNDFKNAGPVFALITGARPRVRELSIVDYADVFGSPAWVAGALAW